MRRVDRVGRCVPACGDATRGHAAPHRPSQFKFQINVIDIIHTNTTTIVNQR
jgi:hypothetical protein